MAKPRVHTADCHPVLRVFLWLRYSSEKWETHSKVQLTFEWMILYARSACLVSLGKPAPKWLCPSDCWAAAEATRGCERKPIKKCHRAPLSTEKHCNKEKKIAFSSLPCPLEPLSPPHIHAHAVTTRSPDPPLSLESPASQPFFLKQDESGEPEFPADCWHPQKITLFFFPLPHCLLVLL